MPKINLNETEKTLAILVRREFERATREAQMAEQSGYAAIFKAHGICPNPMRFNVDFNLGEISWADPPLITEIPELVLSVKPESK